MDSFAPFIESIRIKDGEPQLLRRHIQRMHKTAKHFALKPIKLKYLSALCPQELRQGEVKCRILYHNKIEEISFAKYEFKLIKSLALAQLPKEYSYSFKSSERAVLDTLRIRSRQDEVLLIDEQGYIRDSSFSNLVFRKGGELFTPSTALLNGVQRQELLEQGRIKEKPIYYEDLTEFSEIAFINAMRPLREGKFIQLDAKKILSQEIVKI